MTLRQLERLLARRHVVRLPDGWRVCCGDHPGYGVVVTLSSPTRAAIACLPPCSAPACSGGALGIHGSTIELDQPEGSECTTQEGEPDGFLNHHGLHGLIREVPVERSLRGPAVANEGVLSEALSVGSHQNFGENPVSSPKEKTQLARARVPSKQNGSPEKPHPTEPAAAIVKKPFRSDLEGEILRLAAEGRSHREIARTVQVHHVTVSRVLRRVRRGEGPT